VGGVPSSEEEGGIAVWGACLEKTVSVLGRGLIPLRLWRFGFVRCFRKPFLPINLANRVVRVLEGSVAMLHAADIGVAAERITSPSLPV
jgi:hypothetical protein